MGRCRPNDVGEHSLLLDDVMMPVESNAERRQTDIVTSEGWVLRQREGLRLTPYSTIFAIRSAIVGPQGRDLSQLSLEGQLSVTRLRLHDVIREADRMANVLQVFVDEPQARPGNCQSILEAYRRVRVE